MNSFRTTIQSARAGALHLLWLIALLAAPAIGQTTAKAPDFAADGVGIVKKLSAGDFAGIVSRFDAQMAKDLPQARLAEQWKSFSELTGAFVRVTKVSTTEELGHFHSVAMTVAFAQAPQDNVLVVFDRSAHIAGLYFGPQPTEALPNWKAPDYANSSRFHEIAITVEDNAWHLPGTLTVPNGTGPFPAIVLVPGSPPLDEDATVGPNKIFKDIAWGLASRGIAVLRYTKRAHHFGAGLGGGQLGAFTLNEELNDDATAALSLLSARQEINHQQTYLLGHSLGGVAVTQMAQSHTTLAGIVVLGTPAGDLLTALVRRAEDAVAAGGEAGHMSAAVLPVLKKLRDRGFAPGDLAEMFGERNPAGFWEGLRGYQPGASAAKLKVRVLVGVGKHDAEVPPDDWEQWTKALSGRANAALKLYPGLFHLFMPSTATGKGDSPEDWGRPAHVDSAVVDDIASWILLGSKK